MTDNNYTFVAFRVPRGDSALTTRLNAGREWTRAFGDAERALIPMLRDEAQRLERANALGGVDIILPSGDKLVEYI